MTDEAECATAAAATTCCPAPLLAER